MKLQVDETFLEETRKYGFIFCCEDCAHFVGEDGTCAHFFPNRFHRQEAYQEGKVGEPLLFCKEFEAV